MDDNVVPLRRDRAHLLADLMTLASCIAHELMLIDHRLRALRADLERLQPRPAAVDPSLSQSQRSDIVDASYQGGDTPNPSA